MKREAATATAMQAKASKEQLQQLATTDLIFYKTTRVRLVLFLIIMEVYKINGNQLFLWEVYNFYEEGEYEK